MDKLRRVYPNVLEMAYEKREKTEAQKSSRRIKERIQDPLKLFEDFTLCQRRGHAGGRAGSDYGAA